MFTDFVINGEGHGPVGDVMSHVRYDPGLMRPYLYRGVPTVTCNTGRRIVDAQGRPFMEKKQFRIADLQARGINSPVFNATSLRKEDWIELDRVVVMATRQRLRAWMDLEASSSYGGFDGMAKMTHEYEAMSDPGEAVVDMSPITEGRMDSPLFKLRSVPLPITHSDFWYDLRRLAQSRNSNMPLDTVSGEASGRRVGEMIEKTLIGTETGVTYGTQSTGVTAHDGASKVWGYTNFTYRVTKTNLTTPDGTNPQAILADVIAMRETMYTNGFYGPFILYTSTSYDQWMDNDYFRTGSTAISQTPRERIKKIEGITDIRRLDYLTTGYQMILVQMTPEVAQAINAMDVTVVQWETHGGMKLNFKVMAIKVPVLKAPYNGIAGIIHGTTS